MDMLIKNALLITPEDTRQRNILIHNGIIEKVSEKYINCGEDTQIIDAAGNYASAGFIDLHAHLRDPGYTYKEDIESGTHSAVKGGFTAVLCMPNTEPCINGADIIKYIYDKSKDKAHCNVLPIGAVTAGQKGECLTDFAVLKSAGAIALSDDGKSVENAALMREALTKAKENNMLVISHCEDLKLARAFKNNPPNSAEDVITARDIILAGETGARLHIAHVSSQNSVDFAEWGKRRGYKITAETCPHYFSLTDKDAAKIGVNAKMNPPLRSKDDVERVIEGIKSGVIDCIATDHAPHSPEDKREAANNIAEAANGILGFETAFAAGVTYLVKTGIISLNKLIEMMTANPAKIIGIDGARGQIKENMAADIAIFDIGEKYVHNRNETFSKSKNTPYNGFEFYGRILYTIVSGKIKYNHR